MRPITLRPVFRPPFAVILVITFLVSVTWTSTAVAQSLPTGEVKVGQSILEPTYNDLDGALSFVSTPIHAPVHPNIHNQAPFYLPVYPTTVASIVGTLNCQHQPQDNCPDHGPEIAGLAKAMLPSVYGGGVWGHDHIFSAPPAGPPTGGDFNIIWLPVAVLFTSQSAASNHITTLSQLNAALAAGQVIEIPLVGAQFHCSVAPAAVYNNGKPVPPAPPLP